MNKHENGIIKAIALIVIVVSLILMIAIMWGLAAWIFCLLLYTISVIPKVILNIGIFVLILMLLSIACKSKK